MQHDDPRTNLTRLIEAGIEFRFATPGFTTREAGDDVGVVAGYAAVFNRDSQPLGWSGFVEEIAPGAFAKTIDENDIRALWNHDTRLVLGRNIADTLRLNEDRKGLQYEIDMDLGQYQASDWYRTIARGDVSQSSFGFEVVKETWDWDADPVRRTLNEVRLWEVSPVTFPAYLDTEVDTKSALTPALRNVAAATGRSVDDIFAAGTSGELRDLFSTAAPDPSGTDSPEPVMNHSAGSEARHRRLELIGRRHQWSR